MELTMLTGAAFKGVILNKITSPDQGRLVTEKLREGDVPVIGSIGFHDDLQQACLDGNPLDDKMAFEDMGSIVRVLQ